MFSVGRVKHIYIKDSLIFGRLVVEWTTDRNI